MWPDETDRVEYKSRDIDPGKTARQVVAFSNTYGGKLFFGVSDRGETVGITSPKELEETVTNICRTNCEPPVVAKFSREVKDGKTIVIVEVERGSARPYKNKIDGRFYIRVGPTVREASIPELAKLFAEGSYKPILLMMGKLADLKNEACAGLESETQDGARIAIQKTLELRRLVVEADDYAAISDGVDSLSRIAYECAYWFRRSDKGNAPIKEVWGAIGNLVNELGMASSISDAQLREIWLSLVRVTVETIALAIKVDGSTEPFQFVLELLSWLASESNKRHFDESEAVIATTLRALCENMEFLQAHFLRYGTKPLGDDWVSFCQSAKEAAQAFPIESTTKVSRVTYDYRAYSLFNQAFIEGNLPWGDDWLDDAFKSDPRVLMLDSTFFQLWRKDIPGAILGTRKTCKCLCGEELDETASYKGFHERGEYYLHLYYCEKCHRKYVGFFHKY